MNRTFRFIIPAAVLLFAFFSYLIYEKLTENEMGQLLDGEQPFGIELVLAGKGDAGTELFSQMIVFPEEKHVLFYFANTDSFLPGESPEMKRPFESGGFFTSLTGIRNRYFIKATEENAARLLDLLEGMEFFMEEPEEFPDARFQYPVGIHHFSGPQILEYALILKKQDPGKEYLAGVNRLYRAESALLSVFWNRKALLEKIVPAALFAKAFSLISTDMNMEEMQTFAEWLSTTKDLHASVKEVPLELSERRISPYQTEKILLVKEKRAASIMNDFKDDLSSGSLKKLSFAVEVVNGTEINGFARKLKQFIQDRGPLVLDTKNYGYKPLAETVLIDRSGGTFSGEKLSALSDIKRSRVFFSRSNLEVDISFLIGTDFDPKKVHLKL